MTHQSEIFKHALTEAFKQLKKKGYMTRQNFWCCQSCAWAAVPEGKGDKVVFYHRQDTEGITRGNTPSVCLAWSGDGTEICSELRDLGLVTNWDGSEHTRIEAMLLPEQAHRVGEKVGDRIHKRMAAKLKMEWSEYYELWGDIPYAYKNEPIREAERLAKMAEQKAKEAK